MPILGTSPDAIDLAEDRERFQQLLDKLGLKQPENGIAYSVEQAARWSPRELGYPVVMRPSYVLGGRAHGDRPRRAARDTARHATSSCRRRRATERQVRQINPVLHRPLFTAICDAIEVDVDCLCDGKDVFVAGIMEHIEEAGIHSGDSRLLAAAAFARSPR